MTRRIVCITDCVDIAAVELQATLSVRIGDDMRVEPVVPVRPAFSIINGNFAMRLMAGHYPAYTTFLSTIGPLGARPRAVIGRTKQNELAFVGRDNGVFDWLTRDFGCEELYDISHRYGEGKDFVNFAGRSVTAPIAADVARGADLAELGEPVDPASIRRLELDDFTIVHVDNFGNIKFTGQVPVPEEGTRYTVHAGEHTLDAVYRQRMMGGPDGSWALYPGSSFGMYELGMVRGCGAAEIGAAVGDVLHISVA